MPYARASISVTVNGPAIVRRTPNTIVPSVSASGAIAATGNRKPRQIAAGLADSPAMAGHSAPGWNSKRRGRTNQTGSLRVGLAFAAGGRPAGFGGGPARGGVGPRGG